MATGGLLLLQLFPMLCGAAEHYIRPTDATNTPCPGQPCFTIDQYANQSDRYFKSNITFKFLPGTHHLSRPLLFQDLHNVTFGDKTLKYSILVENTPHHAGFDVQNSDNKKIQDKAAIVLLNVTNFMLSNIELLVSGSPSVEERRQRIGIFVWKSTHFKVHSVTLQGFNNAIMIYNSMLGIIANTIIIPYSKNHSVTSADSGNGLLLLYSSKHVNITNSSIFGNSTYQSGIVILSSTSTSVVNTNVTCPRGSVNISDSSSIVIVGAILSSDSVTLLVHSTTKLNVVNSQILSYHSEGTVISFNKCSRISITHFTATTSDTDGLALYSNIWISKSHHIYINNCSSQITIYDCHSITISNSTFETIEDVSPFLNSDDIYHFPAVVDLFKSHNVNIFDSNFIGNTMSSIKIIDSEVHLQGIITFANNSAYSGSAFVIDKNSSLIPERNCHVHFVNNHARSTGGVFYVIAKTYMHVFHEDQLHPMSDCFLYYNFWETGIQDFSLKIILQEWQVTFCMEKM